MTAKMRLLLISAMYENGGNTTHRLFDGHPQMLVYPFESQLGTRYVVDHLSSLFPLKYRWPRFVLGAAPEEDYEAIIDEECKVRCKTPHVSKFRHVAFRLDDRGRRDEFVRIAGSGPRGAGRNVAAFFQATFAAWENCSRTGNESVWAGYSPIIVVDADKIMREMADSHVLHIVRNPYSAYADTKKRPVPLSLAAYLTGWTFCQHQALLFQKLFPGRVHLLRYEDIIAAPAAVLGDFCERIGLRRAETLGRLSWNGTPLAEAYPWGTIRLPDPGTNLKTARELSREEIEEITLRAYPYLEILRYEDFL